MAERLLAAADATPERAIASGYLATLGRPPDAAELADSVEFVKRAAESYQSAGKDDAAELALADFCQVLLGLNEFIYID